jgi:hypothetical protein
MPMHIVQRHLINPSDMRHEPVMQSNANLTNGSKASQQQPYDTQVDIEELRTLLTRQHTDPKKQRFCDMYDTIQELIKAGLSHAAIIRKLKSMDLSVSPVTFKNWLAEIQRERDGATAGNQPGKNLSKMQEAIRHGTA